jgi:hypothetical protein
MNEKLSSQTFFIISLCFAGLVSADILNDSLFIDAVSTKFTVALADFISSEKFIYFFLFPCRLLLNLFSPLSPSSFSFSSFS